MSKLNETTVKKLSKLLPMLTSNQPGEVSATVAAIMRTLGKAGNSMHDVVSALEHGLKPNVVERIVYRDRVVVEEKIVYRDREPSRDAPAGEFMTAGDVMTLGHRLIAATFLNDRERDFILNMIARAKKDGPLFSMTPKQHIWFRELAARPQNIGASH